MKSLLLWWAWTAVLAQAFVPLLPRLFQGFPDGGLPFAKPLAIVALGYVSWLLTSLGLAHSTSLGVTLALIAAIAVGAFLRFGFRLRFDWREEALFFAAFLGTAGLRALSPDIFGAEKYMDFAFFNGLVRAEHFPPVDPWLSGDEINYYYFGYLIFANLARLSGVAPEVAYNLSIATIGAVLFTTVTSLSRALTGSLRFGLLGGAAATLFGNLDGFRQLVVERRGLGAFDWWRSSRVVPNTINEFPFFSLVHGDLHPHVTALVVDLALIGIACGVWHEEDSAEPRTALRPLRLAAIAMLLAAVSLTNPWDLPILLGFLGLTAAYRFWDLGRPFATGALVVAAIAVLVAASSLLSLPFSLHFDAPFQGIGWVHERTRLLDFMTVFGLLLAPAAIVLPLAAAPVPVSAERRELILVGTAFAVVILYLVTRSWVWMVGATLVAGSFVMLWPPGEDARGRLPWALLATGAVAFFICELVYLRDNYGSDFHRMNTVFKLYFQAWLFFAIAFPWFAKRALDLTADHVGQWRTIAAALALGIVAALFYPGAVIALRWPGFAKLTLDGTAYLERDHPSDAFAIDWLRANVPGQPVILEATGKPYSYFARVSSNTGLPTVLGWANHEGVWRIGDSRIAERAEAVREIYDTTDLERASELLAEYDVRYVFVGEVEREEYGAEGLAKFEGAPDLFQPVFRSNGTTIYEVFRG